MNKDCALVTQAVCQDYRALEQALTALTQAKRAAPKRFNLLAFENNIKIVLACVVTQCIMISST